MTANPLPHSFRPPQAHCSIRIPPYPQAPQKSWRNASPHPSSPLLLLLPFLLLLRRNNECKHAKNAVDILEYYCEIRGHFIFFGWSNVLSPSPETRSPPNHQYFGRLTFFTKCVSTPKKPHIFAKCRRSESCRTSSRKSTDSQSWLILSRCWCCRKFGAIIES